MSGLGDDGRLATGASSTADMDTSTVQKAQEKAFVVQLDDEHPQPPAKTPVCSMCKPWERRRSDQTHCILLGPEWKHVHVPGLSFQSEKKLLCQRCVGTLKCICEYQMRELDLQMKTIPEEHAASRSLDRATKTILYLIHAQCEKIASDVKAA